MDKNTKQILILSAVTIGILLVFKARSFKIKGEGSILGAKDLKKPEKAKDEDKKKTQLLDQANIVYDAFLDAINSQASEVELEELNAATAKEYNLVGSLDGDKIVIKDTNGKIIAK